MPIQHQLAEGFTNAIDLERKCDVLLTTSYLESYSPKKLARFGLAVVNLLMTNMRTGLAGKTLIELSLDPSLSQPGDEIHAGSIRVGDIVKLDRMSTGTELPNSSLEGVITKLTRDQINVSVGESDSDDCLLNLYNNTGNDNARMWLVKLTNSITYKRMLQAMNKLSTLEESKKSTVIRILLGEERFTPLPRKHTISSFFDENLNESQKEAVEFATHISPVTIIHGPPGTGKTYTLIEIIKQLKFNHGERILVCGASNISVDNILERLSPAFSNESTDERKKSARRKKKISAASEKLIRIGHPARLLPVNLRHSLDVLSKSSYAAEGGDNQNILKDIVKDIGDTLASLKKCKRYGEKRELWSELKKLKKELREREKKIVSDLLVGADVILSTLHGSGANELYSIYKDSEYNSEHPFFDTIIIDEVSQSLEPQCWIPLLNHLGCKRLIIAGDNKQLPPTVESKEEARRLIREGFVMADLEKTLFDRLLEESNGHEFKKLLNVQYRMNAKIMEFPSRELYDGELKADNSVRDILLTDLPNVKESDETPVTSIWYDTQGGDFPEQVSDEDSRSALSTTAGSKFNESEALVVACHIKKMVSSGILPSQIGVISPYSAQVATIKKVLSPIYETAIEVSTVDGFQGREKEAIVLSLVRSNDNREVGFLNDPRRLNVAMTRAKRHLCVVGDMELLNQCGSNFLANWACYADANFEVRYPEIGDY